MTEQEKIALEVIEHMFRGKKKVDARTLMLDGAAWIRFLLQVIHDLQAEL